MIIKFPPYLTIRCAKAILEAAQKSRFSNDQKIVFDLSRTTFVDPFGVTILAGTMRECAEKGVEVSYIEPIAATPQKFLQGIGFYRFGESTHGSVEFPGRQVELRLLNNLDPTYSGNVIEVLNGYIRMSEGVQDSLLLSINELMTNTFDHSKTLKGCLICAQAYSKKKKEIDLCITDFGIGILQSLTSVDKYKHLNDALGAIELSVKEGVSSRSTSAGLGLAHIQRFLTINHGQMHIISGDGWVKWDFQKKSLSKKVTLPVSFNGTIVDIIARADGEGFYLLSSELPEEQIF